MRALDVGVVGCGTAGGAAAVFLARAGHRVTIYERVSSPNAVGAGITIQPSGLHVLGRLGLATAVIARGARIDQLACVTRERKNIVDLAYPPGRFGLGTHRGVLFEALFEAARREPGVTLRTGTEIVARTRVGRTSWLVDAEGTRHGPHDLVVVADGARSRLRPGQLAARYPWGALWYVARDERERDSPLVRTLHQVVDGNHTFMGLLPTGLGPASVGVSAPLVSLFWSIRGDRVEAWRARGLDAWKSDVAKLAPEAEPVLAQIHDQEQLLFAAYHDVVMPRWHARDVVYLGDAAHATSPQLGQGSNLALWDAMELADCLDGEPHDLGLALARYSRRRELHLAVYQTLSRVLTPFFQGDERLYGQLRDLVMPLFARVGPFRRLMTLCMEGVVDGFAGRTLPVVVPESTE